MNHIAKKIVADSFNDLFIMSINSLMEDGKWTEPRGFRCKELIAPQLVLTNPKNCLITLKDRRLNYAYLIIEKMMYLSQFCNTDILIAYNNKMKDYLNLDTNDFDGAYGPRILQGNQLEYCYNELKNDKDSRRAVITIHNSDDCRPTKDSACTLSWQFMIRNGKLDMITTMRSNDILWGTCLDIPAFCFIQEVLAKWLDVPVGIYIHNPASLHFYDNFELDLIRIIYGKRQLNDKETPIWDIPHNETQEALDLFWDREKSIRETGDYILTKFQTINTYLYQIWEYWNKKNERLKLTNEQQDSNTKGNNSTS